MAYEQGFILNDFGEIFRRLVGIVGPAFLASDRSFMEPRLIEIAGVKYAAAGKSKDRSYDTRLSAVSDDAGAIVAGFQAFAVDSDIHFRFVSKVAFGGLESEAGVVIERLDRIADAAGAGIAQSIFAFRLFSERNKSRGEKLWFSSPFLLLNYDVVEADAANFVSVGRRSVQGEIHKGRDRLVIGVLHHFDRQTIGDEVAQLHGLDDLRLIVDQDLNSHPFVKRTLPISKNKIIIVNGFHAQSTEERINGKEKIPTQRPVAGFEMELSGFSVAGNIHIHANMDYLVFATVDGNYLAVII